MKKILFIQIVAVILMTSCDPPAKNYSCKEYSPSCELNKDLIMFLPLSPVDTSIVDVFGEKINTIKNQWYMTSTKSHTLFPVNAHVYTGSDMNGTPSYEDFPSPTFLANNNKKVKVDTLDISNIVKGIHKVALVISGPNEIKCAGFMEAHVLYPK
ncbi:MAG: hypothetical protein WCI41_02785 [bacterium]